jgi:hypothetical protein
MTDATVSISGHDQLRRLRDHTCRGVEGDGGSLGVCGDPGGAVSCAKRGRIEGRPQQPVQLCSVQGVERCAVALFDARAGDAGDALAVLQPDLQPVLALAAGVQGLTQAEMIQGF